LRQHTVGDLNWFASFVKRKCWAVFGTLATRHAACHYGRGCLIWFRKKFAMVSPKHAEFDNFVKRQQQLAAQATAEKQIPFDPQKEVADWVGRLNALFVQVNNFLDEYIAAGSISTKLEDIELNEEFSGPYIAPKMIIRIGLDEIKLIPIGTMLIGSRGRVDVVGRAGTSRLLLVNKKAASAAQLVSVTIVDQKTSVPAKAPASQPIEWAWKIVSRPPALTFIELNKESFLEIMLEVSNA
jgi:hypothetical protein